MLYNVCGQVSGPLRKLTVLSQFAIVTITFCCDNLWKSNFMAPEMPGKLWQLFFSYFVATLIDDDANQTAEVG